MHSVVQQYFETVRPMHEQFVEPARRTADVVLDWRRSPEEQARTVVQAVRERQGGEPLEVVT